MFRLQKDLLTRVVEVTTAWEKMRPHKEFYGLNLEGFKLRTKPFLDARDEILNLESQLAHATSKRDAAAIPLTELVKGVVSAVKGDPTETENGGLYAAMGYVPTSQRSTGLVRRRKVTPVQEGGSS